METPIPVPPEPEADAPAGDVGPLWPTWYAFVGFLVAMIGTVMTLGIGSAILGIDPGADSDSPEFVVLATLVQGAVFVATAVGFAGLVKPPRTWHFGLRPAPFWRTVGWATAGMVAFYVFAAVYTVLVQSDAEQTVTQDLGADQGTVGLIMAGITVIAIAPVVEEFFFRGFFYRALRSGMPMLAAAAVVGLLFGLIHYTDPDSLSILPPLGVLGFIFCIVYEKTGTLFAPIGMHAINNTIAYAVQADEGWTVSVVVGPLVLVALVVVARALPSGPLAGPAPPVGTVTGR
jgi:hypothetical protein